MNHKKITKKSLQSLIPFADGTRLTEKEKKEMDEAIAKHRAPRNRKKAA